MRPPGTCSIPPKRSATYLANTTLPPVVAPLFEDAMDRASLYFRLKYRLTGRLKMKRVGEKGGRGRTCLANPGYRTAVGFARILKL